MAPPVQDPAPPGDGSEWGMLLHGDAGITAEALLDPVTGQALLLPGTPVDRPPPAPDQIRAGIIDSGVLPEHPQLRNLVVGMKDFTGDDPIDRIGHGTVVAILSVADHSLAFADRPASDATLAQILAASPALLSAKVTDATGRIAQEHVIAAIEWMAAEGARTVNMSFGFLGKAERHAPLCEAIARHEDILFLAAAGNFGPGVTVYPAGCPAANLIRVGAVIGDAPWPKSGRGDLVANGRATPLPPHLYHAEEGRRAAAAGAYGRARESYHASLAVQENTQALSGLALLDLHAGDAVAARDLLHRAAVLAPGTAGIEAHLGAALLMTGQPDEALAPLDRAIALDPGGVPQRKNRAIALARLGRLSEARAALNEARPLAEDPAAIDALIQALEHTAGDG